MVSDNSRSSGASSVEDVVLAWCSATNTAKASSRYYGLVSVSQEEGKLFSSRLAEAALSGADAPRKQVQDISHLAKSSELHG